MNRIVTKTYQDPVDIVWIHAAAKCGIQVVRDPEIFAAWDGRCQLRIGTAETLDADDSLAQMILHELCHALVAGPDAAEKADWGLDYDDPEHRVYEHATLRLQAALADQYGLRPFFASTTDYRYYFDRLPADPLFNNGDPASALAVVAMKRFKDSPWARPLHQALKRTRTIANEVCTLVNKDSVWRLRFLE